MRAVCTVGLTIGRLPFEVRRGVRAHEFEFRRYLLNVLFIRYVVLLEFGKDSQRHGSVAGTAIFGAYTHGS